MAQKKSPPPSDNKSKGRRPSATLDLKATEVSEKRSGKVKSDTKAKVSPKTGSDNNKPASSGKTGAGQSAGAPPPKEPVSSLPPKSPDGGSGDFRGHIFSGLAGGALVLLGTILFQNFQSGTGSNTDITDLSPQLTGRIDTLEQRLNSLPKTATENIVPGDGIEFAAPLKALDELKAAMQKLEIENAELRARVNATDKKMTSLSGQKISDEIKSRLRRFEETIAALATSANNPSQSNIAEIASLVGRINDFESMLDVKIEAMRKSITQNLTADPVAIGATIEVVETLISGANQLGRDIETVKNELARDLETAKQNIADVKTSNERLQQKVDAATTATRSLDDGFKALKADVETTAQSMTKSLAKADAVKTDMQALSAKLAALSTKLNHLFRREDEQRKNANNVLLSLELANLKRAIDRGQPYANELEQIRRLADNSLDLTALDRYKNIDVLSISALQKSFRKVAREILSPAPGEENGSVLNRILSSAKSIVRIRKTGNVPGDTSEAIVARMEANLEKGDLDGVLTEGRNLPDTAIPSVHEWLQQIEARHTIDQSLLLLEEHFKSSLKPLEEGQAQ